MKHWKTGGLPLCITLWFLAFWTMVAQAQSSGTVVAWGRNSEGQCNVPAGLNNVKAISAGLFHVLALKSDGTVVAWGQNGYGECNVPSGLTNVTAIAAGQYFSMALKSDGTVIAWGNNSRLPAGLNNIRGIRVGGTFAIAFSPVNITGWGDNDYGQLNIPPALSARDIGTGSIHSLALKSDGTVIVWGDNSLGQGNVPTGLNNVIGIYSGPTASYSLALKSNGTIVAWGLNSSGQCNVPAGLNSVVAAATGNAHVLALKSNGTVVAWGDNTEGQCNVPAGLRASAVSAGYRFSVAIVPDITSDLYVSASYGSDTTGDGSFFRPYLTVTKALSLVPASQSATVTIYVDAGNYGSDRPRITKKVRLVNFLGAYAGPSRIGKP